MKILKIAALVLAAIFVIGQFFRTERNISSVPNENFIGRQFPVPAEVDEIIRTSCYDCHSDNTVYPWYANIQPAAWWLGGHIANGKRHLNFDQFSAYRPWRQFEKLGDMKEQVSGGEMPLPSYLLIHRYAILNENQKSILFQWTDAMRDTMKARYPADSLQRPARKG